MFRIIFIGLIAVLFTRCNSIDLQQTCLGEWSYFVNDTTYCELLISSNRVFPYHYDQFNNYSYNYHITNDTFYLYGNEGEIKESSPIKYLGPDSFQILGITPTTLKRVKHKEGARNSLTAYDYKMSRLLRDKDINQLFAEQAFVKMDELQKAFDVDYRERRRNALYHKEKAKLKNQK